MVIRKTGFVNGKCQGDHGGCRANYRCCLPALAGFVSPQSMGPGNRESAAEAARIQGETFSEGLRTCSDLFYFYPTAGTFDSAFRSGIPEIQVIKFLFYFFGF